MLLKRKYIVSGYKIERINLRSGDSPCEKCIYNSTNLGKLDCRENIVSGGRRLIDICTRKESTIRKVRVANRMRKRKGGWNYVISEEKKYKP